MSNSDCSFDGLSTAARCRHERRLKIPRGDVRSLRGIIGDHTPDDARFPFSRQKCRATFLAPRLRIRDAARRALRDDSSLTSPRTYCPHSQDRFVGSLTALRDKNQRTVYRLTLVAGWNASDAAEYAKLIDLGKPDLIEIKGMTYCGATSGASNLTMKNVPYHEDVKKFGEALCTARLDLVSGRDADASAGWRTPAGGATEDEPLTGGTPRSAEYGLACEHAHSCCILLARKDPYLVDGKWHTWIDYEKFQDLVASGEPFTSDQYMLPTPHWSVWGAEEGGFDPGETRVRKVRNHPGKEKKEEVKA